MENNLEVLVDFAEYPYNPQDQDWFADGGWIECFKENRQLFDEDDEKILKTQARMRDGRRYKFFECLAAIRLFQECGYLSLLEKYATKDNHERKKHVVKRINSDDLDKGVAYLEPYRSSGPDLLVYTPDYKEWFFAEAKSPDDRTKSKQMHKFIELVKITGKPIKLINFRAKDFGDDAPEGLSFEQSDVIEEHLQTLRC